MVFDSESGGFKDTNEMQYFSHLNIARDKDVGRKVVYIQIYFYTTFHFNDMSYLKVMQTNDQKSFGCSENTKQ